MKSNPSKTLIAAAILICALGANCSQGQGYGDLPADRIEVLTRGPVHEAFAEPVPLTEENVVTVTVQPPDLIAEAAPSEMPQGANMAWIPGYWCWDTDINNFLWVSGCWRAAPPQCSWIPGYWARVTAGWQWTPGFWASSDATEIQYLSAPPASLEEGPPGAPPTANDIWAPGCWVWQQGRYAWRAGFWQAANPNWQWIPAHYVLTPRGSIFVEGYWDYMLSKRGVLFAPIFCPTRVYGQAGFAYTPSVVIDIELLVQNLFCCPRYDHYYFGDYYDARYEQWGIFPWFEGATHHEYFDPIFAHRQWKNRDNHEWLAQVKSQYGRRQLDPAARPARTYSALEAQIARLPEAKRNEMHVAAPLSSYVENKDSALKFQKITPQRQAEIMKQTAAIHEYKTQRSTWEAPAATGGEHGAPVGPAEVKTAPHVIAPPPHVETPAEHPVTPPAAVKPEIPRVQTKEPTAQFTPHTAKLAPSPVAGPKLNTMEKESAPPPTRAAPQPNPEVQPRYSSPTNTRDQHK